MSEQRRIVYGLNDVPKPFTKALGLGIQHVLTMFGATIAVPLILAPAMGMDAAQTALLVAAAMLSAGVATLLQVNFGTRLPLVQGMSFAFLNPFFVIIAAVTARGGDPATMMSYIAGAIILGAFVEMIIGFSGLMGLIQNVLSPVVIGPVIALIGLALFEVGAPQAGQNWLLSGLVIFLIFYLTLIVGRKKPTFSLFSILTSIVVVYLLAVVLTMTGFYAPGTPGAVDFSAVSTASVFRVNLIFPWGMPRFDIGFFLAVLAGYLASIIESYGDYNAVSLASDAPELTGKQVSRGIGMEGIGCFLAGVFGGLANTSYTENIGLVGLTGVASRYVVNIGAVVLILLGIFGKFGGIVATVPSPIIGGLYCALFGLIAAIGISNAAKADLSSMRNMMIMGFILFMGLSVPAYFKGLEEPVLANFPVLSDIVTTIGSTGMAVAAILGLILDNLIPGTLEERGISPQKSRKLISEKDRC
ncbi:MAG: solute carrier family 23 protein [Bacillota bacterium]|nr:solute carrier family 23 protein [Bacillota bacterium]MDW7684937.1 solute carrier family 23 protein [Bacillota bacterium]